MEDGAELFQCVRCNGWRQSSDRFPSLAARNERVCKACHNERTKESKRSYKHNPKPQQRLLFKRCPQCALTLPFVDFNKGGTARHGLQGYCRKCNKQRCPGTRQYVRRT